MGLTGFDLPEVSKLLDRLNLIDGGDEDDDFDLAGELAAIDKPQTKPGELIELGPHRLLCGDCTKPENIERLLDNAKVQMVFTDPPYAVDYRGGRVGEDWKHKIRKNGERYWDERAYYQFSLQ